MFSHDSRSLPHTAHSARPALPAAEEDSATSYTEAQEAQVKSDIRMAAVYTPVERFEKAVDRSGLFVCGPSASRHPRARLKRSGKLSCHDAFSRREPLSALLQNAPRRAPFYARLPLADRLSDVLGQLGLDVASPKKARLLSRGRRDRPDRSPDRFWAEGSSAHKKPDRYAAAVCIRVRPDI